MADEYSKPPQNRKLPIPSKYNRESLTALKGAELEAHYTILLREVGQQKGIRYAVYRMEGKTVKR